jgi:YD repeat-containing protein
VAIDTNNQHRVNYRQQHQTIAIRLADRNAVVVERRVSMQRRPLHMQSFNRLYPIQV